MTPEEAARETNLPLGNTQAGKEFLLTASPRQIQRFIHNIAPREYNHFFNLAKVALDIQLAEEHARIAKEQSESAAKLEQHTITLVNLTNGLKRLNWVLIVLTAGLLIVTIGLAVFQQRSKPENKNNNPSHHQTAP
jgi:hypothetical protein